MKRKVIGIFVVLVVFEIGSITSAFAEEINLSLSPSRIEVIALPGESVQVPLSLTNKGSQTQSLSILFKPIDFAAKQSKMFPFTLTKDEETLGDFIDVRPDETVELLLVAQIPKDAASTDHYTTLLFQTRNKGTVSPQQTASYIEAGVGTYILLSIEKEGEKDRGVTIEEFQTNRFVNTNDPLAFTLEVKNEGKHFAKATGRIDLVDPFNNLISTVTIPVSTILAASSKNLTHETERISPKGLFGKYVAIATVTIGDQVLTQTVTLYVVPKNILLTILGILFAVVFLISRIRSYLLKTRRLSRQKRKK